jgi:hypothetical protein
MPTSSGLTSHSVTARISQTTASAPRTLTGIDHHADHTDPPWSVWLRCLLAAVSPRRVGIERQRVESGLGSLYAILTSRSLSGICRRVRAGCELGHGNCANRQFAWELPGVDLIQVDHDRVVDDALAMARDAQG